MLECSQHHQLLLTTKQKETCWTPVFPRMGHKRPLGDASPRTGVPFGQRPSPANGCLPPPGAAGDRHCQQQAHPGHSKRPQWLPARHLPGCARTDQLPDQGDRSVSPGAGWALWVPIVLMCVVWSRCPPCQHTSALSAQCSAASLGNKNLHFSLQVSISSAWTMGKITLALCRCISTLVSTMMASTWKRSRQKRGNS